MTQTEVVAFIQPTGGCGPILSYLYPPIVAGVMPTPKDSNNIITRNGQSIPLADQGNEGLTIFYNIIPP